ncbi:MAG TPA: ABC transporter ATP-binding protein, partial [Burkholderiaceae bacterium]|nr:ABC transporter ATP-binding protein [Burkholderiaceae bacterium]
MSKKFARSLKRSFVYGARDIGRLLFGRLLPRATPDALRPSEFWAVRDVSFALHRGRSLGIVGQNGSGKTTLLRMVAGVLRPTLGSVRADGAIAPMLALGAGFKPVLSGRENVFLNLALLGVGERAARARFDAILDFAELHDAIDAPLGTYSSGMQARLGFACAVHTEPSILIVDEVLAVGDARFRMKCRNRINELRRAGTALLLVSHSPILVEALCDEALLLRGGRMAQLGPPREVLKAYEDELLRHAVAGDAGRSPARVERPLPEGAQLAVRGVDLHTPGGGSG